MADHPELTEPRPPPANPRRRLGVLGRSTSFRYLWLARLISFFGDSLGLVALILFVAEEVGTGLAVGLLLLAGDVTPTLVSPLTGALVDRLDQRRLMIWCEVAQGLVVGVIALLRPATALLLVLVALRALLSATFQPAGRSAVPELVAADDLEAANALLGFGTYGLEAAGPLFAALLLPLIGVRGLLVIDALTFLVAVPLLLRLPALPPARDDSAGSSLIADARVGLRFLWRQPVVRTVVVGFSAVVLATAVDDVALVLLGQQTFGASESAISVLYAGSGLGLLIGFAALARWGRRVLPVVSLLLGFAVASAGNLLTGLAPTIVAAFTMQVLRGLGISLIDVGHHTLLQRWVPRHLRGRVFANLYGALGIAAGISYAVGGPLIDMLSPRLVLALGGASGLLATGATGLLLARQALRQPGGWSRPAEDNATDRMV